MHDDGDRPQGREELSFLPGSEIWAEADLDACGEGVLIRGVESARQRANALTAGSGDQPRAVMLGDVGEQVSLQEIVDHAVEDVRVQFGESAPERVEAVPEGTAPKRRAVDAHRLVGEHGVERAVIE